MKDERWKMKDEIWNIKYYYGTWWNILWYIDGMKYFMIHGWDEIFYDTWWDGRWKDGGNDMIYFVMHERQMIERRWKIFMVYDKMGEILLWYMDKMKYYYDTWIRWNIFMVHNWMKDDRWQMTDDRWQMTDERWQMTDDRWQMTDDRWQMTDDRWQIADDRWQIADDRWQMNDFTQQWNDSITMSDDKRWQEWAVMSNDIDDMK